LQQKVLEIRLDRKAFLARATPHLAVSDFGRFRGVMTSDVTTVDIACLS
jgi:hypothetical protein